MDKRETLTHQVAIQLSRGICSPKWRRKNWIKGRGSGREYSCADQIDRVSDSEWPLRAAQFLKPPALPGDTYKAREWSGFRALEVLHVGEFSVSILSIARSFRPAYLRACSRAR